MDCIPDQMEIHGVICFVSTKYLPRLTNVNTSYSVSAQLKLVYISDRVFAS